MPLQGLPDYQQPLRENGLTIYRTFEGSALHVLLPESLAVAERDDGRPEFLLELVRGQNPLLPPKPYGVLDTRLRPTYRSEEALNLLRSQLPEAMLEQASFTTGFMRLAAIGEIADAPEELFKPVALTWNGLGLARFLLRLPLHGALLLKGALAEELLLLKAIAEMEMIGVSPRLPIRVRFNPATLMEALGALADEYRQIIWQTIVQFFRRDFSTLPLQIIGRSAAISADEFAEAMADRVRLRFAAFIPAPKDDARPYVLLQSPAEVGDGSFEWDLAAPIAAPRPLVLSFNPLEVARQLGREKGLETVIRQTVVPPLQTGTLAIDITANLPAQRLGVLSLGVTINAAPHPPQRVQALIETVELTAPQDMASVGLRLSPIEEPNYSFTTFVIIEDADGGITRYEGATTPHSGERLDLQPRHFPLAFVPVEASTGLLQLADIHGVCHRPQNGVDIEQPFELGLDHRSVVLALPKETQGATLEIEVRSKDGARALRQGPLPAAPLRLDLTSFREYGRHKIEIECVLNDETKFVAIDLLPEGREETPDNITVFLFTPAQPKRDWVWFAKSPFYSGYRYRLHRRAGEEPTSWFAPRSAFARLVIEAGIALGGGA